MCVRCSTEHDCDDIHSYEMFVSVSCVVGALSITSKGIQLLLCPVYISDREIDNIMCVHFQLNNVCPGLVYPIVSFQRFCFPICKWYYMLVYR